MSNGLKLSLFRGLTLGTKKMAPLEGQLADPQNAVCSRAWSVPAGTPCSPVPCNRVRATLSRTKARERKCKGGSSLLCLERPVFGRL